MQLNWQRGIGTALMGMGDTMKVNYANQQKEAASIRAEDRAYQTGMRKDQEMYSLGQQRQQKQRNDLVAQMEASGQYSEAEIASARSGAPISQQAKQEGAISQARGIAEVKVDVASEAKMNELRQLYPDKTDNEIAAIRRDELEKASMTAAERNDIKVQEIIGEKELADLTTSDKTRLAIYGVTVPGQQKPLTGTVKKDVWKAAREEAQEAYSVDNMDDATAINEANTMLRAAGKKHQVKTATQARDLLTENHTAGGYIRGIALITGQMATETPTGTPIPTEAAEAAIAEVAQPAMPDAPEVDQFGSVSTMQTQGPPLPPSGIDRVRQKRIERQQRRIAKKPGGQEVSGLQGYRMPKTVPQIGGTTLPEQQAPQGALQGDTRVNDIISRMR